MAENVAGHTQRAVRSLLDALAELDRLDGVAPVEDSLAVRVRVLVSLSLAEFPVVGLEKALDRLADAERIVDVLRDEALRSRVEYQRAAIYGRSGDIASAGDRLERTLRNLDDFTERESCSVLLSRGMVALTQLRPVEAAASFERAAELAHGHGFVEQEFMALHNQGYATYLLGDLPRALALMEEAERIEANVSRGPAHLERGHVLLEAGLLSEAIRVLNAGADISREAGDQHDEAEFDLHLARAYRLLGRLVDASDAARQSELAFMKVGAESWAAQAHLVELQVSLVLATGHVPTGASSREAEATIRGIAASADSIAATAERFGDVDLADRARTLAAHALIEVGDDAAARERLEPGRKGTRRSLAEDLNRVRVTAALAISEGKPATARRLLTRAAGRLVASGRGSASLDLRTASAVHGVDLAALDLGLSRERGSAAVLASLERWRSIFSATPSLLPADDPVLADLTERLRTVQRAVRDDPAPDELRRLRRRAALLEDQIRSRDWTLSQGKLDAKAAPVRIHDARAELDALGRDLMWFFRDGSRLCGVGVVAGRAVVRDLMDVDEAAELARQVRVDLRAATTQHLGPFRSAVWGSLHAAAQRLDRALVAPWRSSADGIVIVVDRSVSALPWSILPSLKGVPITVALSLSSFAAKSALAPWPAGTVPAVYVGVGPGLDRADHEAAEIGKIWGDAVRIPTPSTARGVLGALATSDVVHVAAHGSHERQSPLFSTLSMHDGPVFAYEAQRSGVTAGHVILSACEVGAATVRPGEETLGMAASLICLGARSVVAAVAPVPDEVAADVMVRHHRGLAAGLGSDEALAAAIAQSEPEAVAFLNLGGRWRAPHRVGGHLAPPTSTSGSAHRESGPGVRQLPGQ